MTTYKYEQIGHKERRAGLCPKCGRRVVRVRSFIHTLNPFNRNLDGTIKNRTQVLDGAKAEAAAWVPDFTHETCRESGWSK